LAPAISSWHLDAVWEGGNHPICSDVVRVGIATPKLTEDQVNMLDLPLAGVIAAQKHYQDGLHASGQSPDSVAATHRSAGFEFEFAKYAGEELPSHIVLAESEPFSDLYPLRFVLETDSGSVLEIGFPPLLFRNRPGGGPNTPAISLIFNKAQTAMSVIGAKQGLGLGALCNELATAGFGTGWTLKDTYPELETGDRSTVKKLAKRGVYSQLNISLTPDESAALIDYMAEKGDAGSAEESALGPLRGALLDAMQGTSPRAAKIHMARAFASLGAAFDIARGRYPLLPRGPGDDLSSIVKELHGVWIKDVPANILAPYARKIDPQDVDAGRAVCQAHLNDIFGEIDDPQVGAIVNRSLIARLLITQNYEGILKNHMEGLRKLDPDNPADFEAFNKLIQSAAGGDEIDSDDLGYEAEALLDKMLKAGSGTNLMVKHAVDQELATMADMMKAAGGKVDREPAEFGNESLGSGKGVRKDTHLPPVIDPDSGRPVMSIAELRSTYVVNKFLENN
jgi:hypothetical protein